MIGEEEQGPRLLTLREALGQVDVHALKFIFQTRSLRLKLLWFILFFGGIFAAGYYISQIIVEFKKNPTATKVSAIEYDQYAYPPVYICPRFYLDIHKLKARGFSNPDIEFISSIIQIPDEKEGVRTFEHEQIRKILEIGRYKTYAEFYTNMAMNFSQWVVETSDTILEKSNFPLVYLATPTYDDQPTTYRVCYKMIMDKYTPNTGQPFYLEYEIPNPDIPDVFPAEFKSDYMAITNEIRLVLEKDRIKLRKNRGITIRLSPKKYIRFNSYADPCIPADRLDQDYSYINCRYQCYIREVESCFDCVFLTDLTPINVESSKLCSPFNRDNETAACVQAKRLYKKCLKSCLHPCEYFTYDHTISLYIINQTYYADDRIAIWMYYEVDDGLLVYQEIPTYTWASMVSNIGGQLGLWTGASILTILELIYLLSYVWCTNWKQRRMLAKRKDTVAGERCIREATI